MEEQGQGIKENLRKKKRKPTILNLKQRSRDLSDSDFQTLPSLFIRIEIFFKSNVLHHNLTLHACSVVSDSLGPYGL